MTVRVTRTDTIDASPSEVWAFISDPANRARAISVVRSFSVDPADPRRCTWEVDVPVPLLDRTVTVETTDRVREPPSFVEFEGRSSVMNVTGRHEIEATDGGSRLESEFVVDGSLPGVEGYFTRQLDRELENLRRAAEGSFSGTDGEGSP